MRRKVENRLSLEWFNETDDEKEQCVDRIIGIGCLCEETALSSRPKDDKSRALDSNRTFPQILSL